MFPLPFLQLDILPHGHNNTLPSLQLDILWGGGNKELYTPLISTGMKSQWYMNMRGNAKWLTSPDEGNYCWCSLPEKH